jgi:outer membrane protein TolC
MARRLSIPAALIFIASLFGCVAYRPHTIEPPRLEQEFRNRTLTDSGLIEFVQRASGAATRWPSETLNLQELTWIAVYYSPDVRLAHAQLRVAEAQIIAAGAKPNPSLSAETGYNTDPESAGLFTIIPNFTIETAGKRGYRILRAERMAEAARLAVTEAAWLARSRVRAALKDHLFAARQRDLLRREELLRTEIVEIFDRRLEAGEAARPELDVFRVDLVSTQAALQAADGEVNRTFAALASAAGVPVSALAGVPVKSSQFDLPLPAEKLPLRLVQRAGLLNRIDIRRLLTEYAAADAELRLEVARQYPDLQIGPGYTFEEGFSRYTFTGGLAPVPLFHRNRGMIGVAEAERSRVQAQVETAQARAIGEMETALTEYRSATAEWNEAARRLMVIQTEREAAAVKALEVGEGDRLAVVMARLQSAAAERARLNALSRAQTALGALEDAVQQPLESGVTFPDPFPVPRIQP